MSQESELRNPETWDVASGVVRPGMKTARAVVSVAFSREGFNRVANAAVSSGVKTSEFIREAALEKANILARVTDFDWNGIALNGSVLVYSPESSGTSTNPVTVTNKLGRAFANLFATKPPSRYRACFGVKMSCSEKENGSAGYG